MSASPHERSVPGERWIRIALRCVHVASASVLLGGHAFGASAETLRVPLLWTVATGVLFVLFEWGLAPEWAFQGRGLATGAKVLLLLLVPVLWAHRLPILLAAIALAVVGAHMPSAYRYRSIRTGEVGSHRRG